MNARKSAAVLVTGAALLLAGVGIAQAAPDDDNDGVDTTQDPAQGATALLETLDNGNFQLLDALNGDNRPDGANGVESEFPPADPRFVEGPVGGLLNGPFD